MAWSPLGPSGGVVFLRGPPWTSFSTFGVSGLGIFIKEKINVHCKDLAHRGGRGQSCASRCMGRVRGGGLFVHSPNAPPIV